MTISVNSTTPPTSPTEVNGYVAENEEKPWTSSLPANDVEDNRQTEEEDETGEERTTAFSVAASNGGTLQRTLSQAETNLVESTTPLYKIVLTGGPCGGKTTSLARLSYYLRERGFEVMTCPEAFSILINNGMSMEYYAAVEGIATIIQSSVMDMQMSLEDSFQNVLKSTGKPSVLLCDRGLMDGSAYCSPSEWEDILRKKGIPSSCHIREGRYNAVFHMVTAAEGAEKYYTLENNLARTETPETARKLDKMTQVAWVGHPKLFVFDNSTDFEGKLQRLVNATAQLVGLPSSLQRTSAKFLLRSKPQLELFPPDVKYHVFEVEKVYLYDDFTRLSKEDSQYKEEYSFIRKRRQGETGAQVYGQTTVKRTYDEKEIEVKRIISKREYNNFYKTRDLTRHIIKQTRVSFIWNMQSFNVHIYSEPIKVKDLCILHCQFEGGTGNNNDSDVVEQDYHKDFSLPPFLDIGRK